MKEKKYVTWPFWLQFLNILYVAKILLWAIPLKHFDDFASDNWIYTGIAFVIFGIIGIVMSQKKFDFMKKYRTATLVLSSLNVYFISIHILFYLFIRDIASRF